MIDQSQKQTRDAVLWKLESLQGSNLFQAGGLNIREVLHPGQISVFLLRNLDNATKSLVVSVFAKKIFGVMGDYHTKRKVSRRFGRELPEQYQGLPDGVWILVDEAHLVCPADAYTAAKESLVEYVKRGRDAGLSLVLATQQPAAVDSRVVSQIDLLIVHRLVVDGDISAALARVPADFPKEVSFGSARISERHALVRALDTGEAWVADAETGRAFLVAMRPRVSAHGGDEPVVI
jgi:DNA helicase HerA-like ATPase